MPDRHSARAARALAHLPETDPAIAALALWCEHRDGGGATRTEGDTIVYGPEFSDLPLREQVGLAAHHVLHVALRHGARAAAMKERVGPGFDAATYGLATDAVLNEALLLSGHALPRPAVRLVEVLSRIGTAAASPEAALGDWDADKLFMAILAAPGNARKAVGGYAREKRFTPDVGDSGREDAGDLKAAEWQKRLSVAFEAGRAAGTGIGRHAVTLALVAAPRVPWERHLRRLVTRAVSEVPRQSDRRPSNRWIAMEGEARRHGTPTPGFAPGRLRDGGRPRIVVGLDTSSSVDDLTLELFATEAAGVARRTGAETYVMAFDDAVHSVRRMGSGNWEHTITGAAFRRGGGTDFRPMLQQAAALQPSIIVVLSDLDGPMGPAPQVPVIWAVPDGATGTPEFGRLLRLAG